MLHWRMLWAHSSQVTTPGCIQQDNLTEPAPPHPLLCPAAEDAAHALVEAAHKQWAVRYRGRNCDDVSGEGVVVFGTGGESTVPPAAEGWDSKAGGVEPLAGQLFSLLLMHHTTPACLHLHNLRPPPRPTAGDCCCCIPGPLKQRPSVASLARGPTLPAYGTAPAPQGTTLPAHHTLKLGSQ